MTGNNGRCGSQECGSCAGAHELLRELLDSDTSAERAGEIRRVIAQCPECFSRYENETAARLLVRTCCGGARAPEDLRRRITASVTTVSVTQVRYRR